MFPNTLSPATKFLAYHCFHLTQKYNADDVSISIYITLKIQICAVTYTRSMHYILHSIYDQRSPIPNKFLFLFLLQSLHDYLCCRARHTHAPHLLQPTLPPLQSSICSKAIRSSNSMSIYLLECFSARPSVPVTFFVSTPHIWPKMDMPIQYRFGR